ncbi:hypothetical protein ACIBQX_30060, partial [Nonomuraea sp. NPDC049714]|uniref:hypothetical protein n=1 Tax=Nonomuraea sp. NPDC049714 TaxID=3364357 RepID=UPI0037B37B1C
DGKVEDGKPDAKTGDGKPDAKVEEGKPDGNVCEDDVQDRGITDTPAKDHPDDRDPSRPQVVEVDGVKVIQVPIDPPTANQLESILENLDKVQPIDMPQVDGRPGQADGYADRPPSSDQSPRNDQPIRNDPPTGSDQPIRNDPPTGSGQPARIDPPTGVAPPSGTDQPPATQPPASDGCSDNGSGRDGGISRDAQPGGQDVRDPRQDGNAERNDPPTGSDQPIRNDPPTGSDQPIRNDPPTGSGQPARIDPPTGVAPPSATDQPPATQPPASDGCSDNGSGRDGGISRDAQPGGQDVRDPRQDGNAERNDNDRQDGNAARDGSTGQDNARQDAYGGRDGNTGQDNTGQDNTGQDNARQDSVGRDGVGQGARDEGGGLVVPPTPPPDSATGTQSVGTQSPPRYDGTGVNAVPGAPAGVSAWVSDGGDVVSVNVDPPAADSIRLLVGDTRGVQPVEMPGPEMSAVEAPGAKVPGVEVLPGEWRDGVWVPEDIEPDGPRGSVDPGTPERSA